MALRTPRIPRLCALFLALVLHAGAALAQVELRVDNDLFGVRGPDEPPPDHEYTHGTSVAWDASSGRGRWEVGQRIYTPRRDAPEPVPGERPYAGWLYGARERITFSPRALTRLRVEAGVTGPPALAEPVQDAIHRLGGYEKQLGWAHQLGFEPAVAASFGREHRLGPLGGERGARLEVLPSWTVRAGTVRTGAEAGVRARLALRAGDAWTGEGAARGVSGWIEAAARQEAVLRDLFLDGNTFGGPSSTVEKRRWVAQGEAALGVRWRRAELEYRFVLRGREYATQHEPHPYGSIRLRVYPRALSPGSAPPG